MPGDPFVVGLLTHSPLRPLITPGCPESMEMCIRDRGRDLTRRTLLKDGDVIASGDTIEVVMTVKTKNDVEYLMLRDPKPCLLYTSRCV